MLLLLPLLAHTTLRLDSIVVKRDGNSTCVPFIYDSLGRLNRVWGTRLEYNDQGKLCRTVLQYERKQLRPTPIDKTNNEEDEPKLQTLIVTKENVTEYDSNGNIILQYSKNENDIYDDTYRTEYTYNNSGKLIAKKHTVFTPNGEVKERWGLQYEYNKKGILASRKQLAYQGTRFWRGDKIVESPELQCKVVGQDRCDKRGNIIFHRDYETGDTLLYEYDDLNRMTSVEWHNGGKTIRSYEYTYDRYGNPTRMDEFSGAGNHPNEYFVHERSYTITYDLNSKSEETAGVKQGVVTDLDFKEYMYIINRFQRPEIEYTPTFVNVPVCIEYTDPDDPDFDNPKVYYYYSTIK